MSKDMTMIYGGVILPEGFRYKVLYRPNETTNTTLGGHIRTDFRNTLRTWSVSWDVISEEDFTIIYNLYMAQYSENSYEVFRFDAFGINVFAKLEINEHDLSYNGSVREGLTILIKEAFPFS